MGHTATVTIEATDATGAHRTVVGGLLTPAEAAPLLGYSRRRVAELIAEGWFPPGAVVRVGHGKRKAHTRLVLQRLVEARLVLAPSTSEGSP